MKTSFIIILSILAAIIIFLHSKPTEVHINMEIIKRIESRGNTHSFNSVSGARGLYGITPILVKEFNRMNNTHYKDDDMYIPIVCEKVAVWYMTKRIPQMLKAYGIKDNVENRLIAYNAGIKAVRTNVIPKETRGYIRKYNRMMEAI